MSDSLSFCSVFSCLLDIVHERLVKYEMAYNEVSKEVIAEEHIVDEYEERFSKGDRTVRFYPLICLVKSLPLATLSNLIHFGMACI